MVMVQLTIESGAEAAPALRPAACIVRADQDRDTEDTHIAFLTIN